MDKRKHTMIQRLVQKIEHQLGWGSGEDWSNKDFEALSEQIFNSTKKRLSVTTLKRIWGRAELVANPSLATLDILSEFVGHKNWREYTASSNSTQGPSVSTLPRKRVRQLVILGLSVLVALLIRVYYTSSFKTEKSKANIDPSHFTFESKVVSSGIPNSVVFKYNAAKADDTSEIEIQQDWDERKRITVKKEDSIATSIYYRPGFFKSKLVVNGTIVKEDDVFITTEGWLGTINKDFVPIYLEEGEISHETHIGVDEKTLSTYQIDSKVTEVTTSLYYVNDFPDLYTNDFHVSMLVKNDFEKTLGGCQEVEIYVLYDGGAIGIPLGRKGCISNLNLMAFGQYINGKKNDLSAFGVDFNEYVQVSCSANKEALKFFVNGNMAYTLPMGNKLYSIKGISIHFEGSGSVKDVTFKNSKGQVFELTVDK
jgi:hypothetical protein